MASETTIHAHKYQHFEDLQLSAREFYTILEDLITSYGYPGVSCIPVTLKESGIFSSSREYLRISKQRYNYYVCASPFGRSFFISWWLKENANTPANIARKFGLFGRSIAQRMESKTYYEIDTETMFASSINSLIALAVERVKNEKGFRNKPLIENQ